MPAKAVAGREEWMIEVFGRIMRHAEFFHDPPRAEVLGSGE